MVYVCAECVNTLEKLLHLFLLLSSSSLASDNELEEELITGVFGSAGLFRTTLLSRECLELRFFQVLRDVCKINVHTENVYTT
jgi:hypothetical protein